ncbi:MAG TPA: sigma-70 family RNA polymerase sigma factor [Polyangia bacterium]|nr:sigma-70 family RNA polymerase sigma factor [Polyangia bacterium]
MDFRSEQAWWSEVLRIARRHMRLAGRDAADDLAQDIAVAALQNGASVERPGAWLERVARNAARDRWRRDKRRSRLLEGVELPPSTRSPEGELLLSETRAAVRREIAALPPAQQQVAVLRFEGELPLATIAARQGTPSATARSQLHRALTSLRHQLKHLRATAILGWPGVQTTALSLALLAVASPAAPLPAAPVGSPSSPKHSARYAPDEAGSAATIAPAHKEASPAAGAAPRAPRPSRSISPAPSAIQVFNFENEAIAGEHDEPDDELVRTAPPARHSSLLELRADFLPELAKSLEDL